MGMALQYRCACRRNQKACPAWQACGTSRRGSTACSSGRVSGRSSVVNMLRGGACGLGVGQGIRAAGGEPHGVGSLDKGLEEPVKEGGGASGERRALLVDEAKLQRSPCRTGRAGDDHAARVQEQVLCAPSHSTSLTCVSHQRCSAPSRDSRCPGPKVEQAAPNSRPPEAPA